MQTSFLLALLCLAMAAQSQEFTCDTTSAQALPICCGEYYAYNTTETPSDSPYYYAIFCGSAPLAADGSGEYECEAAQSTKPACCGFYETREEMAFDCAPVNGCC